MKHIILLLSLFSVSLLYSQGTIKGTVKNTTSTDEIIGSTIILQGTSKGARVNFDGTYTINNVAPGKYLLICRHLTHEPETLTVNVKSNEITTVNITLKPKLNKIKEVSIVAKAKRNGENYTQKLKKKSLNIMEAISSEEMAKKGDGNAAAVARRITGVSVASKGYVYVRGLSDRYSMTTLNGARIPGLDPNKNSVALTLFPSSIIDNMEVFKSFTPDLPGSFTGGLINIVTKDFPERYTLSFSTFIGVNTESSFRKDFLTHQGGSLDFLGFDDGSRAAPEIALSGVPFFNQNNSRLEKITKSFNPNMGYSLKNSTFNQKYSFSIGNKYTFKNGKELGIIGGLTYSFRQLHRDRDAYTNRYDISGNVNTVDALTPNKLLKNIFSTERVLIGALVNASLKLNKKNKLSFLVIRNQKADKRTGYSVGELSAQEKGLYFENRELSFIESSLTTMQLKGTHKLNKKGKLDWTSSFSLSNQSQPDLRYFLNDFSFDDKGDKIYKISPQIYNSPTRFFRELSQLTIDNQVNYSYKVFENLTKDHEVRNSLKIKTGASVTIKTRAKTENTFRYEFSGIDYNGNVSDLLNKNNFNLSNPSNIYIISDYQRQNNYDGKQNIYGGYFMTSYRVASKNIITGGLRVEITDMKVTSFDPKQKQGKISEIDLLPSISLKREQSKKINLRVSYTRTLARPSFREIAPFSNDDFLTGWKIVGVPDLKRSLIDNLDARFEFYPGKGQLVSASIFYKNFTNPIERISNPAAGGSGEIAWRNLNKANLYGLELDFKHKFKQFTFGYNFSYIVSNIDVDEKELASQRSINPNAPSQRAMYGQPPYIHNFFLEYAPDSVGFSANLSYNYTGPKIAVVMIDGTPHVYDQPYHSLNFNVTYRIKKRHALTFKANNIINPIVKKTQTFKNTEYIYNSYRAGANISLGYKYSF